jgi:hypothetical protein
MLAFRPLLRIAALLACSSMPLLAQGVRVKLPAWPDPVLLDSMRTEHEIAGAPEAVYGALQKAFADLDIPKGNTDGKAGIIASERFERMRVLGGSVMSRSFSCGESATGPNADAFRLSIAIAARVKPGPNGNTVLGLAAAASGSDITGVYRNPRECASTGFIEQKILNAVQKYVK